MIDLGLRTALAGRDELRLVPVMEFILKYISNPRYASLLIDVSFMILDIYASVLNQSLDMHQILTKLKQKVQQERTLLSQYNQLLGHLVTLFAAAQ